MLLLFVFITFMAQKLNDNSSEPSPDQIREQGRLPAWAARRTVALDNAIDCGTGEEWRSTVAGAEIHVRIGLDILLQGTDTSGKSWRVRATYPGDLGCRLITGDLDSNGHKDLILLVANGGSGANGLTMIIVTFDRLGRPVPWQAAGAFSVENDQILNFVDLDRDGQVDLLYSFVEKDALSAESSAHFYLYSISNGYLRRTDGPFAERNFPIDYPSGRGPVEEPSLTNSVTDGEFANMVLAFQFNLHGRCLQAGLSRIDGGIEFPSKNQTRQDCQSYLQLQNGIRTPIPLIIVTDTREGRTIDITHSPNDILQQVVRSQMTVAFVGTSCEAGCRPFVMWARKD
jgi:hypothetical protein